MENEKEKTVGKTKVSQTVEKDIENNKSVEKTNKHKESKKVLSSDTKISVDQVKDSKKSAKISPDKLDAQSKKNKVSPKSQDNKGVKEVKEKPKTSTAKTVKVKEKSISSKVAKAPNTPKTTIQKKSTPNKLKGTVVGNKMDKTVTVLVETKYKHKLYGKYIKKSKKYHAHYEGDSLSLGDFVTIKECTPISKSKKWIIS